MNNRNNKKFIKRKLEQFRNFIYSDLLSFDNRKNLIVTLLRFIYTVFRVFYANHCLRQGAALAYTTILSIFPLVAVLFFLVPIVINEEDSQVKVQQTILSFLIPGSTEIPKDYITSNKNNKQPETIISESESDNVHSDKKDKDTSETIEGITKKGNGDFENELTSYFKRYRVEVTKLKAIGILGTIIVAIILFITMEQSFAIIWGVRKRPLYKSFTLFTGVIFWIPLLIGLSIYFSAEISSRVGIVGRKMDFLLPLFLTFAALVFAYAFIPNTKVLIAWAMIGAAISSVLWEIAKAIFNRLVFSSTNYQNLFNAVGAIPYLLIWLYISWLIILLGVVITYCGQNLKTLLYEDISKAFKLTNPTIILIILFIIADRLQKGLKGASIDTIREFCHISNDELNNHLELLIHNETIQILPDQQIYVLIKPAEKIFLKDIINIKMHIEKIFHYDEKGSKNLFSQISEMDSSLANLLKDKSLRELLIENN